MPKPQQNLTSLYTKHPNWRQTHQSQPDTLFSAQASFTHVKRWPPTIDSEDLQSVTVGLNFRVRARHFRRGNLKLKCVSQLADPEQPLYWRSREQSALAGRPPEISRHTDGASAATGADRGRDGQGSGRVGICIGKDKL